MPRFVGFGPVLSGSLKQRLFVLETPALEHHGPLWVRESCHLGQIEQAMNTRLYVGNLSFNTNAEGVRAAFQEFGTVSDVHLVSDRETGRSRGFAFVTMSTAAEGQAAIGTLHGKQFAGRALTVNEARPREDRPKQPFPRRPRQ